MAVKTYGHKRYACGCVVSLDATGGRLGYVDECPVVREWFTAMIRDRRPQTKEVSAEWKTQADAHFEGQE